MFRSCKAASLVEDVNEHTAELGVNVVEKAVMPHSH